MGVYDFENIPELTEDEKKSPYADFYYIPVGKPPPHVMEAVAPGRQMDPALAVSLENPSDISMLFSPEGIKCKNGWCVLPDGTGFSAIETLMPDITPELEKWWIKWFLSDDLHYRIWMPSLHFGHGETIFEDLGWGPLHLHTLGHLSPSSLGVEDPEELNPGFVSFQAPVFKYILADDPDAAPNYGILIHYISLMECGGIKFQTLVYSGVTREDGKLVRMIPEGGTVDPERVRLFATHNAYEFARKVEIVPGLYERSKTLA